MRGERRRMGWLSGEVDRRDNNFQRKEKERIWLRELVAFLHAREQIYRWGSARSQWYIATSYY